MASRKITKHEMKQDQFRSFLSEFYFGLLSSMERHWQAYLIGFAAFLVAAAGGFYGWSKYESRRDHSSYLLAQLQEACDAPVEAKKSGSPDQLSFTTQALKDSEVNARLAALERAGGASATLAGLYKASLQAEAGKISDALATVEPLTKNADTAAAALCLRARLYEAQGQWDKAEADWKSLTTFTGPNWPKGEGWWQLGKFYERRSQNDKAVAAYEMVEKTVGEPVAKPDAKGPAPEDPMVKRAKDQVEALKGKA